MYYISAIREGPSQYIATFFPHLVNGKMKEMDSKEQS